MVDRQPGPALETSFANAGEVSPGYSSPWAGPGVPVKAIKWLLMRHGPLVIRPKLDLVMWWLAAQDAAQLHRGALRRQQEPDGAARRIQPRLPARAARRDRHPLRRAQPGHAAAVPQAGAARWHRRGHRRAAADGVPYEVLDRDGCIAAEPALAAVKDKFVGGLRLPRTRPATATSSRRRWRPGRQARRAVQVQHRHRSAGRGRRRITGVATGAGMLQADAYVVALGSCSPQLLRPIGLSCRSIR